MGDVAASGRRPSRHKTITMTELDLSLSPRAQARYAVLNCKSETGFLIARALAGTRPVWQIRHELGDHVDDMIAEEIRLEHEDLVDAFMLLEAFLSTVRTTDVTAMHFKPVSAGAIPQCAVTAAGA